LSLLYKLLAFWSVDFLLKSLKLLPPCRCRILRLKCTKFDFGWGSAPDSTGGADSAHPDPLAGLRVLLLRGEVGRGGEGMGGEGTTGEGKRKVVPLNVRDALTPLNARFCLSG